MYNVHTLRNPCIHDKITNTARILCSEHQIVCTYSTSENTLNSDRIVWCFVDTDSIHYIVWTTVAGRFNTIHSLYKVPVVNWSNVSKSVSRNRITHSHQSQWLSFNFHPIHFCSTLNCASFRVNSVEKSTKNKTCRSMVILYIRNAHEIWELYSTFELLVRCSMHTHIRTHNAFVLFVVFLT